MKLSRCGYLLITSLLLGSANGDDRQETKKESPAPAEIAGQKGEKGRHEAAREWPRLFDKKEAGRWYEDQPGAPEDKLKAAIREYNEAVAEIRKRSAKTEAEQVQRNGEELLWQVRTSSRLYYIAEKLAKTDVAVDALSWLVLNGCVNRRTLLKRLTDGYTHCKNLEPLCQKLSGWFHSPEGEELLHAVLAQSPHRSVQGQACFALALLLKEKSRFVCLTGENDSERLSEFLGEETFKRLSTLDPVILSSRAEVLFERASKKYGNLSHPRGRFADVALAELFEMRSLAVGKVAPEIEGEDIDGVRFKLSEYRKQVVLLVFTGDWCGACKVFHKKHERSVRQRFQGKPFVVLHVNSDATREAATRSAPAAQAVRTWWDGGSTSGHIASAWNVRNWPTIYVIDRDGVIRFKSIGVANPGPCISNLLRVTER